MGLIFLFCPLSSLTSDYPAVVRRCEQKRQWWQFTKCFSLMISFYQLACIEEMENYVNSSECGIELLCVLSVTYQFQVNTLKERCTGSHHLCNFFFISFHHEPCNLLICFPLHVSSGLQLSSRNLVAFQRSSCWPCMYLPFIGIPESPPMYLHPVELLQLTEFLWTAPSVENLFLIWRELKKKRERERKGRRSQFLMTYGQLESNVWQMCFWISRGFTKRLVELHTDRCGIEMPRNNATCYYC